jgi:hypothetical protein
MLRAAADYGGVSLAPMVASNSRFGMAMTDRMRCRVQKASSLSRLLSDGSFFPWRAVRLALGTKLGGYRGAKITNAIRKAARAAVKARTDARAADLAPILEELKSAGADSLHDLARGLTKRGIPTARGGSKWTAVHARASAAPGSYLN